MRPSRSSWIFAVSPWRADRAKTRVGGTRSDSALAFTCWSMLESTSLSVFMPSRSPSILLSTT